MAINNKLENENDFCFNCGVNGKNVILRTCKNGHVICSDCMIECQCCHQDMCLQCTFSSCLDCNIIVCKECISHCSVCNKVLCKNCSFQCARCGKYFCGLHFNKNLKVCNICESIESQNVIPDGDSIAGKIEEYFNSIKNENATIESHKSDTLTEAASENIIKTKHSIQSFSTEYPKEKSTIPCDFYCPQCGSEINRQTLFCPRCRSDIRQKNTTKIKIKSKKKTYALMIMIIIPMIVIFIGVTAIIHNKNLKEQKLKSNQFMNFSKTIPAESVAEKNDSINTIILNKAPIVVVPPKINETWSSVEFLIKKDSEDKGTLFSAGIIETTSITWTNLTLSVDYFLPDFVQINDTCTSVSDQPNNPYVFITISDNDENLYTGWLYHGNFFSNDTLRIEFVRGIYRKNEPKENTNNPPAKKSVPKKEKRLINQERIAQYLKDAYLYYESGYYDEAIRRYNDVLRLDSYNKEALSGLKNAKKANGAEIKILGNQPNNSSRNDSSYNKNSENGINYFEE